MRSAYTIKSYSQFIKLSLLILLCFPYSSLFSQTSVIKYCKNDTTDIFGLDLIRTQSDSLLFLSSIRDQNNIETGILICRTDSNLELANTKHYSAANLTTFGITLIDSINTLVYGSTKDSTIISPTYTAIEQALFLLKLNPDGDTLWAKSFQSNDTINGIFLLFLGQFGDSLIFYGSYATDSSIFTIECGILTFINSASGNHINSILFCDSLYSMSFNRAALDKSRRQIHLAGNLLAKDNTGLEKVFYLKTELDGQIETELLISDSSRLSRFNDGGLVQSTNQNTITLLYKTVKYQPFPGTEFYELVTLDSTGLATKCSYISTSISQIPVINCIERFDSLDIYRLWFKRGYFDVDDSFNLIDGTILLSNTLGYYSEMFTRSYKDCIIGHGIYRSSNFSNYEALLFKSTQANSSCYYNPYIISWNVNIGYLQNSGLNLIVTPFNNITHKHLPLSSENLIAEDTVLCSITSINEINTKQSSISIYPNPAADYISIQNLEEGNLYVEIYDLTGRIVMSNSIISSNSNAPILIDVSALNSCSLYLIRIRSEKSSIYSTKFFKS